MLSNFLESYKYYIYQLLKNDDKGFLIGVWLVFDIRKPRIKDSEGYIHATMEILVMRITMIIHVVTKVLVMRVTMIIHVVINLVMKVL